MKQRLLVSSIVMGLCASLSIGNALAQSADDQNADQKKKETTELQGIQVTGSLIPRAQIETASPTVTITADDMKREGFKNVYDALRSLPTAVGSVQDSQFNAGFTPGATTVSLLGLDPSFTLVLMNGRPLADYPFLYNSSSNFVDLSSIPSFLVDHIDVLPGNNSAIYGSAAIAGVINIVTKQKMDGLVLNYRVGGYTDGGGQQQRLQLGWGGSFGSLDAMFGLQVDNINPIFFRQRDVSASAAANPTLNGAPPIASRDRVMIDAFTGKYDDIGAATCGAISNLYNGTEKYSTRPGFGGGYCGSIYQPAQGTMLNGNKGVSTYGSLKYQINDSMQAYSDLTYQVRKTTYLTGGGNAEFWSTGSNMPAYIYDIDDKKLVRLQHIYAPEEVGGLNTASGLENSYIFNAGIRGAFGSSNWNYDAYFHRSEDDVSSRQRRALTDAANAFFLGTQTGTDPFGYGYPAYHLRSSGHFFGAFTPAQYLSFSDVIRSDSSTYSQVGNITVTNTDLFALPAGSVGFAGLLEVGNQSWDNPIDPRVTAGDFFGIGGTSGSGTRDRQAAAGELTIPVFSMLTADVAARYDNYDAAGNSQGKVTYKVGLEFRPVETLLFRTNYGTAFRAPDMGYVFSTGSSFFSSNQDYYNCRKTQGDSYTTCNPPYNSVNFQGFSNGNKDLKYITAKSWGYGGVWSPTSNFTVKVDYYHIAISNEVSSYSVDTILQKEADCRLGHTRGGTPVDGNSPSCQQFIAEVGRNPLTATINPGALNTVTTFPINVANETVSGITANIGYKFDLGHYGDVKLNADYNTTLKHEFQQFPGDPVQNLLTNTSYYNQVKEIGSGSATWNIGNWSATAFGIRYGKSYSYNGNFTVAPWMVYNATVQYNFSDDASMTLISSNVFNSRPPVDKSYSAYPYYNVFNYNAFGRVVMLEMNVQFGGKKD